MGIKERIREVREVIGLTQIKFAERIAISQSYEDFLALKRKGINPSLSSKNHCLKP